MVPIALTLDDNFFQFHCACPGKFLHNIVLLKDLNLVFHLFFSCGETKIALVKFLPMKTWRRT
jgi:hypothetical protein